MTGMVSIEKEKLRQSLRNLLDFATTRSRSLYEVRDMRDKLNLKSKYPNFIVWGPEVHNNCDLVMYVWSWTDGQRNEEIFHATAPTCWHAEVIENEKKPPTP